MRQDIRNPEEKKFEEKVLLIKRVSKKIPGGNYVTFSALVVVGDKKGKVGIGLGRGQEVPPAIQKAITYAKKHLITVPIKNKTIPHEIRLKYKASKILLKPAPEGTGLKVGSVARVLLDLAGVENASGKIIRSRNQIVNTYAIMKALQMFRHI
ncbi:30S ribosomal protein S5 [Candidatus Roizmanbacteria bacterium CG_4_10_14_0_2_um_filter_36_35]|uniref:Small ribosomal subunit protein uS5 n=4 Tax=Candidatus Roizmaniibacteriota TaxID=1752723 RepID=A0A2M7BXI5_9BACT|nr:MAG: 30S ribosomal protein S5 [Candidatus Roizmanbacteria bacterium CG11_big_fil_rev_8_21_14_0_20_35_14]PIV11281.1 MAG: 30S ribosomal protein S5 [Candidatus Roizmanbacteria bacterium CG03_land_8_20_14_0_80_35_26]PIZ67406.1 MAG: 30S ribosomal protein S5 [Candidatus Roizmanbacteria bacterium CG_4_10_14_0_2_um_filter_36_35]PJC32966.1 MAG: 30S ribosomal protein S5 [Candidatus Roizmanbacteria bacterium CG_4_9_14_0_2_um_filter_36_12]PJC80467.1 MAG: 30S ribosomal protein S5 [Candidatus Roizmanbacte